MKRNKDTQTEYSGFNSRKWISDGINSYERETQFLALHEKKRDAQVSYTRNYVSRRESILENGSQTGLTVMSEKHSFSPRINSRKGISPRINSRKWISNGINSYERETQFLELYEKK